MRRTKALLCDIDGTLVQSNWLHAEAWQIAFREMGLDLEIEAIRRQIGKGGDELIPVFVPWWRRVRVEEPLKQFRAHVFRTEFLPRVHAIAGARDLLLRCRQNEIKVVLASSSDKQDLEVMKRVVGMEELVNAETSADDVRKAKPHPDIFAVALSKAGIAPDEAMALGDTPWDAESAGLAGVSTIGVETGGWSRPELLEAGCVAVYRDVSELLAYFDSSLLAR